ncbi:hypothetical protein H0H92_005272 [Tricholoma furcatifolium]|nr:hypothetical protein H0H92_005272 [Tricholoma furcatifolium]
MAKGRATSTSTKIRVRSSQSTPVTKIKESRVLGSRGIRESIARSNAERRQKHTRTTTALSHSDIPTRYDSSNEWDSYDEGFERDSYDSGHNLHDIVNGSAPLNLSHAGGEFEHLLTECLKDELAPIDHKPKDHRTRRDRTETRTQAFQRQMDGITDAYMEWVRKVGDEAMVHGPTPGQKGNVDATITLRVMDMYQTFTCVLNICDVDVNLSAAIVRQGLVPSAPLKPNFAFSIRTLEFYRITHLRCPHLTVEPFVKSLCDLHRTPFRQYLAQQFTIAYDVYFEMRTQAQQRVELFLGRIKMPAPRARTSSKARMLFTMDGNDSLKRLRSAAKAPSAGDEEDGPQLSKSNARYDSRTVPGDRYLTREEVDRWAKAELANILSEDTGGEEEPAEDNPCAGRWTNMIHEVTAKMWGIFDETGVFLALCRHGFTLVVADMVQSGELSKYPIAVTSALLDAFGEDLGGGYDIGCRFKTTVGQSDLGGLARELRFSSLVGAFHGHAHNRICQLSHLATYVNGMGLEDLEGCERFFSKSNHLAASVQYATPYHRQQKIVEYMAHTDAFETEQKLTTGEFLVKNYEQALQILATETALQKTMVDQGVESYEVFHQWLEEERTYLTALAKEPIEETQEMEYYQKLVNLRDAEDRLAEIQGTWVAYDPKANSVKTSGTKRQTNPEVRLRHAKELVERSLLAVQELEVELGTVERWTPQNEEWKRAAVLVGRRRYQRCLDELERLVVSRMFELTKMNMSQTGYKLRKHIGKALKARSQAIRTALEKYNAAAALMTPRRPVLNWDQVVEYAFLADFDLLRDTRQDIRERPWARPSARLAMDQYYKIQRAKEEIERLNIEIPRVVTHMQDEEEFLLEKTRVAEQTDPALAYHIFLYREERTRFYELHRRRFQKLARNPLFGGSIIPGNL